jgi:hypothetical protein
MSAKRKMPLHVLVAGPVAVFGYWVVTWLLENEPEHWLIRGMTRTADWISERLPR